MSLKWFHLVFISLSTVLAVAFGLWGFLNHFTALGVGSLAAAVALGVYGNYFLQKARRIGLV